MCIIEFSVFLMDYRWADYLCKPLFLQKFDK